VKELTFLEGVKTYSGPSYIFSWGQHPQTAMIYAPVGATNNIAYMMMMMMMMPLMMFGDAAIIFLFIIYLLFISHKNAAQKSM